MKGLLWIPGSLGDLGGTRAVVVRKTSWLDARLVWHWCVPSCRTPSPLLPVLSSVATPASPATVDCPTAYHQLRVDRCRVVTSLTFSALGNSRALSGLSVQVKPSAAMEHPCQCFGSIAGTAGRAIISPSHTSGSGGQATGSRAGDVARGQRRWPGDGLHHPLTRCQADVVSQRSPGNVISFFQDTPGSSSATMWFFKI